MGNLKLWWAYQGTKYTDIGHSRPNIGYYEVKEETYDNEVEYALRLNQVMDLKDRLNKELVFTDKKLAYQYMAEENNKVNAEILAACGRKK